MHKSDTPQSPTSACPPVVRVRFTRHTEFIQELRERAPNVEPVVRVAFRKTADGSAAPLTHVTLLATYLRRLDDGTGPATVLAMVRLAEYLGSVWIDPTDQESRRCRERAELARAAVVRAAEGLGLRVGDGAYEAGEPAVDDGVGRG
jgi:hypothetical protein